MSDQYVLLAADGGVGVPEACRFLGLSRSAVYQLMQAGRLPYAKLGHRRIGPRAALVALLAGAIRDGGEAPGRSHVPAA